MDVEKQADTDRKIFESIAFGNTFSFYPIVPNSPALTEKETFQSDKLKLELKKKFDKVKKITITLDDGQSRKVVKKAKVNISFLIMMLTMGIGFIFILAIGVSAWSDVIKRLMNKETDIYNKYGKFYLN